MITDVLIIGNGPAGLASAITLRQHGASVTVVHRPAVDVIRAGESLAASARYSLIELDLWDDFLAAAHPPCYGNSSCWGDDRLFFYDFIQSSFGEGWYLNRTAFQSMMLQKAVAAGVTLIETNRAFGLTREGMRWQYTEGHSHINAATIIDASGRNSWLSRQLGIKRIREDNQVAVVSLLASSNPLRSQQSLIEAVPDGWWYVSEGGEGKVVRIFFTDPDLHDRADWLDPLYWRRKSTQTRFVKHRVPVSRYSDVLPLQYTSAGSHHLEHYAGEGWLAAGDAACAFDPLSSHGIAFALRSGIDAGLAAKDELAGISAAGTHYHQKIQLAFHLYGEQRADLYGKETRWKDHPYWVRRHGEQKSAVAKDNVIIG
ncbi:NAD(P)/FAD-dependent oxidoreductase [Pedobacter sp. D749]|uniref:NAD(P)/FAD-dependent oxidoreductase n=1 Tax=Pedobacter sp. D749 TaxID=2856523 RepID=UPI001C5A0C72|nr:NAD(P)/FAD-dependent oxidoreductase [Pedobacter sp. D749]QXU43589.1 NAD(P)/FAD-dependent oxidoreductase [Pedobacter sp. D749]